MNDRFEQSSVDATPSQRLDVALASRGLARSRSHARQLIDAGQVTVDGRVARASAKVTSGSDIEVAKDHYVSRGAQKLLRALEVFDLDPDGRSALDVGASTGGFTQVLLERGAAHVTALDVGHGQFKLNPDPRIRVMEGTNVRDVESGDIDTGVDLIVADVSFISAAFLFEPLTASLPNARDWIILIKPQFEVGREHIGDGVVRDAGLRRRAVVTVAEAAARVGLRIVDLARSPIEGAHGNVEFLAHFQRIAHPKEKTEEEVLAAEGEPAALTFELPTQWDELFATGKERG